MVLSVADSTGRCFICNTPAAYVVASVLQRPVESATHCGRSQDH
ncbi:hypothetical protein COAQ111491_17675 [Comamonas aquatilis]